MRKEEIVITGETSYDSLVGYIIETYEELNPLPESLIKITVELVHEDEGDDVVGSDFPCPICGGEVGHRINCPRGIASGDI